MRILYVGPTFRGSNATSWRDAFLKLGQDVRSIDVNRLAPWPSRLDRKLIARIRKHPGHRPMRVLNGAVRDAVRDFRPNLTFFAHGEYITGATIMTAPALG